MVGRPGAPVSAILDPERFREAASAITGAIRASPTTRDQLMALLIECGRLPDESRLLVAAAAANARFAGRTEKILDIVPAYAVDDEEEHLNAIRAFFLQPKESVSIEDLAALWRIHSDDVRDIHHDQLSRSAHDNGGTDSPGIAWASVTFNLLRPFDIDRALGADFRRVRPEAWRTVPFLIHLPKCVAYAIALDPSVPPRLPVDVRIEQIIVELFTIGECGRRAPGETPSGWAL